MAGEAQSLRADELLAHAARLRRLALRLAGERDAAEELVQETWLRALRRPPRADRPLWPWLARVLANRAKSARRDEAARCDRERGRASELETKAPIEVAGELEAQRALVEAVLALDEPERTIVVLRWFHELDSSAIGERLAMPPATVRWRLARAMDGLRARLDARFGDRAAWAMCFAPIARGVPIARAVPSARGAPSASSAGSGAAALQGALVMSGAAKLGACAVVVALAGWIWIRHEAQRENDRSAAGAAPLAAAAEREVQANALRAPNWDGPRSIASESARSSIPPPHEPEDAAVASAAPALEVQRAIVRAVILDRDGRPISGATLRTRDATFLGATASESDGSVELAVPMGQLQAWTQELTASAPGWASVYPSASVRTDRPTDLGELRLDRAASIAGHVIGIDGMGLAATRVWLEPTELRAWGDDGARHRRGPFPDHSPDFSTLDAPQCASGDGGAFRLTGIAAGRYRVWAKRDETRYGWSEELELEGGSDVEDARIVLEPWRPEDRIAGRVLDPDGAPATDARLQAECELEGRIRREPVALGRVGAFDWVVCTLAPHTLVASGLKGVTEVRGIQPGTRDLELRLTEPQRLRVRATDPAGAPIAPISVWTATADEMQVSTAPTAPSAEAGTYDVQLPARVFFLEVQSPGRRGERKGPFDPASAPELVEFVLRPLPVLACRVLAAGAPAAGARIELALACDPWKERVGGFPARARLGLGQTWVDDAGRARIPLAFEWPFYVRAERDDLAPAELGPFSPADVETLGELVLELTAGGAIEGRVLLPDGRDAAGTIVGVNRGDGRPFTQRAGPGGSFRFERLAPGPYEVRRCRFEFDPEHPSYSRAPSGTALEPDCTVADGRTTRFDLDLTRDE